MDARRRRRPVGAEVAEFEDQIAATNLATSRARRPWRIVATDAQSTAASEPRARGAGSSVRGHRVREASESSVTLTLA